MVARKRQWSSLKPATQKRYSRAGIDAKRYEAGESLKAARGHSKTPERPSRAAAKPEKYPEYLTRKAIREGKPRSESSRSRAINKMLSSLPAWEADEARRVIRSMPVEKQDELLTVRGFASSLYRQGKEKAATEVWKSISVAFPDVDPSWFRYHDT